MNKLQAAMKDKSAKGWREARLYFKVGSSFKACANCGEMHPEKDYFISGTQVFRSYKPKWVGWTYKCMECGAIDSTCWADAWDIGQEPRILPKSEIGGSCAVNPAAQFRKEMREKYFPKEGKAGGSSAPRMSERDKQVAAIQAQIAALKSMLEGGAE